MSNQDMFASLDDGRQVLLKADGTWQLVSTVAKSSEETGFRNVRWGAGKEEVKYTQKATPDYEKDNIIGYEDQVCGLGCTTAFIFLENKMVRGKYIFHHEHSNNTDFIYDYEKLKDMLIKKYGTPIEDESWWKDDLYQDDPDDWGMAVCTGGLALWCNWETPITKIYMELSGDNYDINLVTEYASKELEHLEQSQREVRDLEAL